MPILSDSDGMIETRFAFPQRSPYPLTVPWTIRAPSTTAASELATPHSASLWVWMPQRRIGQRRAGPCATARGDLRRGNVAAVGVAQGDPMRTRARRRAQAVERVVAVRGKCVEEVLGVVDDLFALPTRNATDSAIMRSSRSGQP